MASITNFISNFNGGTRKNRFIVTATWPSDVVSRITTYHIQSATMPPSIIGTIAIPYRGREAYYAGDRQYAPWDIVILDDTGNKSLWHPFHQWHKLINKHYENTHSFSNDSFRSAKTNWIVEHLDLNGNPIKEIELVGCWPMSVTPISFNMNSNVYNSFGVRLSYDYFRG